MVKEIYFCQTSTGSCELRPANKAKVSSSSPKCLSSITKAQASVEMISWEGFIIVDGVVATGCMRTIHPNLKEIIQYWNLCPVEVGHSLNKRIKSTVFPKEIIEGLNCNKFSLQLRFPWFKIPEVPPKGQIYLAVSKCPWQLPVPCTCTSKWMNWLQGLTACDPNSSYQSKFNYDEIYLSVIKAIRIIAN